MDKKTCVLQWDYAFAVGKIRALEKFLIRQEVFQEAVDEGINEALKLFVEADLYSDQLLHVQDSNQLESILHSEVSKVYYLARRLLLHKELLCLFDGNNYRHALTVCNNVPSKFLSDYIKHCIDMANIKTFLRLYIVREAPTVFAGKLLSDGFISKEEFLRCYSKDLLFFVNRLEWVHKYNTVINYAAFLGEAIKAAETDRSFVMLEKEMNSFLMEMLQPAKYISFGPEPVVAYYFAKINEINLIRLIVLAKFHNFSSEFVKQRISRVYA